MPSWSVTDSEHLYQIPSWGQGLFHVNPEGNVVMTPPGRERGVDLEALVNDLRRRGIQMPVLLRFSDLIRARIESLVCSFQRAKEEYGFQGEYRGVYPIKVNQDAHVVRDYVRYAFPHHLGLEAGSKPELLVVLAMLEDPEALIICNGYKDEAYVQMALLASRLGRKCIIVVEQASEIDLIAQVSSTLGIRPLLGIRAKLSSRGSGRWHKSVGDRAKFGLSVREIVASVDHLSREGLLDCLALLHFHIGSQVTNIRSFNTALREATRIYTELGRLGAPLGYLDVGGGLGVDYDGSRTNFDSSMNYSQEEYAFSVVSAVVEACDNAGMAHPDLVTESGRSQVAYHATLIFDVLGVTRVGDGTGVKPPVDDADAALREMWEIYQGITSKNLLEPLHDATDIRDQCLTKFNLGLMGIETRAEVDGLFFAICQRLHRIARTSEQPIPDEIAPLEGQLADIYYCNFSLFQSVPDVWAIDQMFPVIPIHRLHQEPTRRAVLADLTCDSDGKIDRFIDRREVKRVLEVHEIGASPYYLGVFLVGAYQEILGDLHNLFGDTHEVHVQVVDNKFGYKIDDVVEGDSIREVLEQVSYDRKRLLQIVRSRAEAAIEAGRLTPEEGGLLVSAYNAGLEGYTYLS